MSLLTVRRSSCSGDPGSSSKVLLLFRSGRSSSAEFTAAAVPGGAVALRRCRRSHLQGLLSFTWWNLHSHLRRTHRTHHSRKYVQKSCRKMTQISPRTFSLSLLGCYSVRVHARTTTFYRTFFLALCTNSHALFCHRAISPPRCLAGD